MYIITFIANLPCPLYSYIYYLHNVVFICTSAFIVFRFHYISGTVPITNGTATVTVSGLECGVVYTITAGGTLNETLVGPRSSHGNVKVPCVSLQTQERGGDGDGDGGSHS